MAAHATVKGKQRITSLSVATALTVPAGATHAWIQAQSQNVRYQLDDTAPTSSVGHQMFAGDPPLELRVETGLREAQFIEETGSAVLQVTYFGPSAS
jgi:hypothetical protein